MRIRRLDEFSLVDRPANPLATIVMSKRLDKEPDMKDNTEAQGLLKKLAQALGFASDVVVPDTIVAKGVKQMPDGKWMAMDDAGKEIGMFDTEDEARAAAYGKKTQEKKMADENVSKADFAKLQEDLAKAQGEIATAKADAAAQAEKVAKLETERKDAEFAKRAEGYAPLPIKADVFGPILRKAADVLTVEENAELDRVLTAASEAMKASGLLKEHGSDSHEEGTAVAKVAQLVADARKANPKLTEVQARAQVYKADPALRREVEAENTERAQAGR